MSEEVEEAVEDEEFEDGIDPNADNSDKFTPEEYEAMTKTANEGYPCNIDGYCNVETANKFKDVTLDDITKEVRTKSGPLFPKLVTVAKAVNGALEHLVHPRRDQLQALSLFNTFLAFEDLSGVDVQAEYVALQVWLCKFVDVKLEGIQPWDEYFFMPDDEDEPEAEPEAEE